MTSARCATSVGHSSLLGRVVNYRIRGAVGRTRVNHVYPLGICGPQTSAYSPRLWQENVENRIGEKAEADVEAHSRALILIAYRHLRNTSKR